MCLKNESKYQKTTEKNEPYPPFENFEHFKNQT